MDLRDTAFALNTSTELNFRATGHHPYNNEVVYSHGDQRADFTADGSCGGTAFGNHYVGDVNHPDDALLPIVGSVVTHSPTPSLSASSTPLTASPSSSATASMTATLSASGTPSSTAVADCSGRFRTLRYTDLDGDVISVHGGGLSEAECQVQCCRVGSACSAYVLGLVTAECFLLANSSSYNAAHYFHAGVRTRDGEAGGGGS